MSDYKFYMQKCDKDYNLIDGTLKDLEVDFDGLKYGKCEGINDYGKPKNVYTEEYSDSNELRVYVPQEITNEATTIKFTFYFTGANRQATYHSFISYLNDGIHVYYDTARKRKFYFILTEKISISDEMWYGGEPYFKVDLTVQNIKGKTEDISI